MNKQNYKKGRRFYNVVETGSTSSSEVKERTREKAKVKENQNPNQEYGSGSSEYHNGTTSPNKRKKQVPNIKVLEKNVLQSIIGQDKQVKTIITAIYKAMHFQSLKSNILVIGNSGTGKTATIKEIATRLNIPYTIEDATKYTQEGYYGADVNEMVYNLIENAHMDLKKAERGIIVIDEIDKKVGREESEVSSVAVLKSLLKIIEGTTIKIPDSKAPFGEAMIDFDTKNIIIILLGAFSGLDKVRDARLKKHQLGFDTSTTVLSKAKDERFLKQDLVKYGMPEEFVGRIDTIVEMNNLTKKDLALILKKSRLSIFRKYQAELRKIGISLSYDGKLFDLIAEESLALDTGARELTNTVNYIFENIMYDVLENPQNKYSKCTLSLEIVKDNTKYKWS